MPPLAIDVMEAQRAALLRADEAAMRAMAQRWLQIEQALQAQVDALVLELAQQGEGPLTMWQLVRLRRYQTLQEQIAAQMERYTAYVAQDITTRQRTTGLEAIDQSSLAINAAAADAGIQLQFDRLPAASIERMVGLAGDGSPLRAVLQDAGTIGADALAQQLVQGVALGLNPRELARRALRQGLATSFTRMVTIARTEVLRVARQTTLDNYRHSNVVRAYRRVASKSQRTCIACLALDGEIYPLTRPFEEHVNGRCVSVPVLIRGTPLAYETGREWFARQPEGVQRQMMGPGRWDLWQSGDVTWDDLVRIHENETWGNSPQVTPVRELEQVAGRQAVRPARPRRTTPAPAAPAAALPPAPTGTAVSKALTRPATKSLLPDIEAALSAIDQVHGDGELPTIPIKPASGKRHWGEYIRQRSFNGQARSLEIRLSTKGEHRALTLAHEVGHFLDFEQIRIEHQLGSKMYGQTVEAEVTAFLDAARKSRAYQRIDDLYYRRARLHYMDSETEVNADRKYCRYLEDPVELWARAYAQYIAKRSGSIVLLDELQATLSGIADGYRYPSQWEDDDFAPIEAAIDAIFRKKGWIQ